MKKLLQLVAAAALTFTAVDAKAQLPDGSIAPDWTFTDIGGSTSHTLYTELNAGKTVFIDVSATWCGPCWSYHNTHALRDMFDNNGPGGTNTARVYYIEGDGATTLADLNGTTGGTQGDWVTGTTYPIINPSSAATTTFNNNYDIGYFPTVYMVCPDRSIKEVGQASYSTLMAGMNCAVATAAVDAETMLSTSLNPSLASCDSVTPTFRIANVGTSTLTSATITLKVDGVTQKVFTWTGSLATYANTTVTGVKVGHSTPGSHTITCEISNPNGVADPTSSNNSTNASFVIYPTTGGALVTQSFEASGLPTAWTISNGGDSRTWENATVGYTSTKSIRLEWYNIPSGDIDIVTLAPMNFVGASAPQLTFDVAYRQYNAENDRLQVEMSTNCGSTWTSLYNKAGNTLETLPNSTTAFTPSASTDWRHETVAMSAAAGQPSVLVRFKGTSAYGNNMYVDNINVSATSGVEESNLITGVNVYPNPMETAATVEFNLTEANNVSVVMVNTVGQIIKSENLGTLAAGLHTTALDASSLSNGLYFLNITVGNNTITKKVSINK